MISKEKFNTFVGRIGAAMGIFVFVAYIPQIIANMQGAKAQPWQATPVCSSILSDLGFVRLEQRTPERLDSDYTQRSRRDIGISDFSDFALNKGCTRLASAACMP